MEVRACRPEDRGAVLEFLARHFPQSPQKADPRYFTWRFESGPLGSSLGDYLLLWDKNQIVGQVAALRDQVRVNGQWRECLWTLDLIIAPEHRGGLAALNLLREASRRCPIMLIVGSNPGHVRAYKALGWRMVPVCRTYFSLARPAGLLTLAEGEGAGGVAGLVAPLAGPACRLLQRVYCGWPRSGLTLQQLSHFDSSVDTLMEELGPHLGVTTFRSAALLNWKFTHRPAGRHFVLACRSGGHLRGYAVVKLMRRQTAGGTAVWGEIADFAVHPGEPDVFQTLMAGALERCRAETDFVRLRCSLPGHTELLKLPFWIRRDRPVIDDVFYLARDPAVAAALASSPWHVTSLVSDRTDHGRDEWVEDPAAGGLTHRAAVNSTQG